MGWGGVRGGGGRSKVLRKVAQISEHLSETGSLPRVHTYIETEIPGMGQGWGGPRVGARQSEKVQRVFIEKNTTRISLRIFDKHLQ